MDEHAVDESEIQSTNIRTSRRIANLLAGFVILFTLPIWNALGAAAGLPLRGHAAWLALPFAWVGCLLCAQAITGVDGRLAARGTYRIGPHEHPVEDPDSVSYLRWRARRALWVASIVSAGLMAAVDYATR